MAAIGFPVAGAFMTLRTTSPKAIFAGLALMGAADVARAHGDYDWIRRGGYRGVDGTSCCGKDDCDRIPAARIERTPQGYRLLDHGLFVPFRQTQTSEDGRFWLCRDEKAMRCFFAPPPGS